jgi:diaminopimelate epimerase
MSMDFVKMQGTGNDFVLLEATGEEPGTGLSERDWPALARSMCDRHFGIGADGIILVLPSDRADIRMRMFNPDGSESEMCGNGIRCFARYAVERGLVKPVDGRFTVETGAGILTAQLVGESGRVQSVRVSMGVPRFAPADIPVAVETSPPVNDLRLTLEDRTLAVTCLSMGNPHAVHFLDRGVAEFPLEVVGPRVERHHLFPQRINFEVARVQSRQLMDVRVWERGAGATLACGSGASAAMVAAHLHRLVEERVEVRMPGGSLTVEWDGQGEVYLTGPAEYVFEGQWPGEE